MQLNPVGVDLAKHVFQLSIANSNHRVIERKRLNRKQFSRWLSQATPRLIVMEACGSCYHWARVAKSFGHRVRLLHAAHVRPYVRGNKTDATDADALLRAQQDTSLRSVPLKSKEQQALQSLHRLREQYKQQRNALINSACAVLAEFGIAVSTHGALKKQAIDVTAALPLLLRPAFAGVLEDIDYLNTRLKLIDKALTAYAKTDDTCHRLQSITGVGATIATAAVARVGDIHQFKRARSFASWLGVTTREKSSGHNRTMGRITKRGDSYLRMLLIHGARSALLAAKRTHNADKPLTALQLWALRKQQEIGHNKATVALANKMARILWAVWTRKTEFNGNDAMRFAA